MRSIIKLSLLVCMGLLSLTIISCKKFLAANSQNMSFVNSVADLKEILIGDAYLDVDNDIRTNIFHVSDDDIDFAFNGITTETTFEFGLFYWQSEPRTTNAGNIALSDNYYNTVYAKLARLNTIISEVEKLKVKGDALSELNTIKGEAHFLRGLYYFTLVNLYGKPYNVATAPSDFGVPLKIDPAITDQFSSRSSVKVVYDQILIDLETAHYLLQSESEFSVMRASNSATAGLLSRVHLYMENYEKSITYADQVITTPRFGLLDLNTFTGLNFLHKQSTEVVFTMGFNETGFRMARGTEAPSSFHFVASDELYGIYDPQDLRRSTFFKINSRGSVRSIKNGEGLYLSVSDVSEKFSVRLSEMYLNKAEAQVAIGENEAALATIRAFHQFRFSASDVPDWTYTGEALIDEIRQERRRELCFEGHRWFDLRRYGVNAKYPYEKSIRHRSLQKTGIFFTVNGFYELGPYSMDEAAYTLPIAHDEVDFNRGRITNEVRPERPLQQ